MTLIDVIRKTGTAARLPAGERREIPRAMAAAVAIEVGLHVTSLPRLARRLGVRLDFDAAGPRPLPAPDRDARTASAIRLAARLAGSWPTDARCLRHALLLGHLLRDHDPVLRIGVAKENDQVAAHAWLEIDGVAVTPPSHFRPLKRSA
jgi:hypothetical protein